MNGIHPLVNSKYGQKYGTFTYLHLLDPEDLPLTILKLTHEPWWIKQQTWGFFHLTVTADFEGSSLQSHLQRVLGWKHVETWNQPAKTYGSKLVALIIGWASFLVQCPFNIWVWWYGSELGTLWYPNHWMVNLKMALKSVVRQVLNFDPYPYS